MTVQGYGPLRTSPYHLRKLLMRAVFLDVLFGFLYLYIHLLFGLAISI